ncbi:MAG: methylenetetrahydrofolate reductase [Treponema sp.]|jgi:methylenetetrahydrofolate reductase (NADPH)|nr:methylenetetrahydrofolate reductase [Treponema sp.]
MKIAEILKKKTTLSFEVFPPKDEIPLDGIRNTLSHLYLFKPDFISCTYGAGGSKRGRNIELCEVVQKSGNTVMPHMTCVGHSRDEMKLIIKEYFDRGFENILALRGDFPEGWDNTKGDFSHANDLIAYLKTDFPQMCIAAAAYPEKHIGAASMETDIAYLRSKQDNGAQFIITQLCHDVPAFQRFLEQIRKAGVTIPVIAGIMPVLSCEPIIRMTLFNGCSIPAELAAIIGKYQNDPASFTRAGIEYTVTQLHRYIAAGVNGLHLYTLNKWEKITEVLNTAGISN